MATKSSSSTALYDDRINVTAKSKFKFCRNILGGGLRNLRSSLAEKLSASCAVIGGAAFAFGGWDETEAEAATNENGADAMVDSHDLRHVFD